MFNNYILNDLKMRGYSESKFCKKFYSFQDVFLGICEVHTSASANGMYNYCFPVDTGRK